MEKARLMGAAALCALAAVTVLAPKPAAAEGERKRSLARCTSFDQREKDESSLELTIKNSCTMPIDCKISWELVCAPASKKRRKVTPESTAFTVSTDATQVTALSAAACGDDSWVIRGVSWRCEASKE
jgi:hypothetical protein